MDDNNLPGGKELVKKVVIALAVIIFATIILLMKPKMEIVLLSAAGVFALFLIIKFLGLCRDVHVISVSMKEK